MTPRIVDRTGERFGRLVAVALAGRHRGLTWWRCRCDCGEEVFVPGGKLQSGNTKSCGCLKRDTDHSIHRTHGGAQLRHPLYATWLNMRQRCTNPGRADFPYYGGRGVTVDPRWDDFSTFAADMGERPVGHTLDRRDNSKGYSPENCRWATYKEQRANQRKVER